MGDLSKSQNGAKRLQQMSGSDSTSVSSWLMQTTHGARAHPTRTDAAVRPYPVEHECRARAARARLDGCRVGTTHAWVNMFEHACSNARAVLVIHCMCDKHETLQNTKCGKALGKLLILVLEYGRAPTTAVSFKFSKYLYSAVPWYL